MKNTYPEGGYGWVIVVSSGVIIGLAINVMKCAGQIYMNMLQTTTFTRSQIATAIVLPRILGSLLAIFSSKLAEVYSYRITILLGTFLLGFGTCLSSLLIDNITAFSLTFGVIVGTGYAFTTVPCGMLTGLFFKKRRSFAIGMSMTVAGIISLLMPPLLQWFLDEYLLDGALVLWGGVMLQGSVAAMLIRQPVWALHKQVTLKQTENEKFLISAETEQVNEKNIFTFFKFIFTELLRDQRHFKNFHFLCLLFNRTAYFFTIVCTYLIIPTFAEEQNEEIIATQSAFILSVISIGDVCGRWLASWVNNWFPHRRKALFHGSFFCVAVLLYSFQFLHDYYLFIAVGFTFGIFNGYSFVSFFVVMFEVFGPADTPGANAIQSTVTGLFLIAAGPTVASIRDMTGSYRGCWTILALVVVFSIAIWVFEPITSRCKQRK